MSDRRSHHSVKPVRRPPVEGLENRILFAVADLSGWTGVGNTSAPNNYAVTSQTSAGGTLDARRNGTGEAAAYLADTTLAGGPFTRSTTGGFDAKGTLTFDASADNTSLVDPVFYLGFFDKDSLTAGAFGMSFADSTTSAFRVRATAGTAQGTTAVINQGSYAFELDVNNADAGSNTVRFRLWSGPTTETPLINVTQAISSTLGLSADSFGVLQPLASSDSDATWSLTLSDINYAGETQVQSPATPTGLTTVAGNGQVTLNWADNATNESGFKIQRATDSTFTSDVVTTTAGIDATSVSVGSLTNGTTYYFRVAATNAWGDSEWSNTASAVPTAQATPIWQHGDSGYSSTYAGSWTGLQTGKQIIEARPATTVAHYNVKDGVIDGNNDGDYTDAGVDVSKKDQPTSVDTATDTGYLTDVNYSVNWTTVQTGSTTSARTGKMWHFQDYTKFVVDNVTLNQVGTGPKHAHTVTFYNIDTVEIRNSTFTGEVRAHHMAFRNVKRIFIDGVEVKGDANGRGGGAVFLDNGDGSTALGTNEWFVVQNSYFHDVYAFSGTADTTDRDAICIHTWADGAIFNNTIENWRKTRYGDIDGAIDISLRAAHPSTKTALFRVERNEFINNSLLKNVGNPGSDANVRHRVLWANNMFLNTGIVDYHAYYTVDWVHNTFVLDDTKKGSLSAVSNFFQWFAYPGPSHTNMYNNVISQVGSTAINALYYDKAPSEHVNLGANNNWIGIPDTVPYLVESGGATVSTAGAWQSSPYNKDVNSKIGSVVPSFANYSGNDFRLAAQPSGYTPEDEYLATGTLHVGLRVYRDFDGETRGSNPTVGAYQAP